MNDKQRLIIDAPHEELANWWPAVKAEFDGGTSPDLLCDLNVAVGDKTVVALSFATDRAP